MKNSRRPRYLLDRPLIVGDSETDKLARIANRNNKVASAINKWLQERQGNQATAPIFYGMYPLGDYLRVCPELAKALEKGASFAPLDRL
jgi:hypothetical protein